MSTAHTFSPGAGDVWFSLNNTTYLNNSLVTLEDIGENDTALLCRTNLTDCCNHSYTGGYRSAIGNWYFPNESRVPSGYSWLDYYRTRDLMVVQWDFYRTRGETVVHLNRRRGGEEGIYHCKIPDSTNVTQTIYIGVYAAGSSEWHCLYTLVLYNYSQTV